MATFEQVIKIIGFLGIPSIFAMITWLYKKVKKNEEESKNKDKAIELGLQALLRAQMINDYNRWIEKEYAPIYAKENFENCWKQYHALGANGVMDDIHAKFMDLPTIPPKK